MFQFSSHHIPSSCLLLSSLGSCIPVWQSSFIPNIELNLLSCCFHSLVPVYLTPLTRFICVLLRLNIHFPTALVTARGEECQNSSREREVGLCREADLYMFQFFSNCCASCQKGKTGFKEDSIKPALEIKKTKSL